MGVQGSSPSLGQFNPQGQLPGQGQFPQTGGGLQGGSQFAPNQFNPAQGPQTGQTTQQYNSPLQQGPTNATQGSPQSSLAPTTGGRQPGERGQYGAAAQAWRANAASGRSGLSGRPQASYSRTGDETQGGRTATQAGGRTPQQQRQFDEGLMNKADTPDLDRRLQEYYAANPNAAPGMTIPGGATAPNPPTPGAGVGTGGDTGGNEETPTDTGEQDKDPATLGEEGVDQSGATGPLEQGDEAFRQISEFRNVGLKGQEKAFQEIDETLEDSKNRQINIINREGLNRQQAIDRGFDEAALAYIDAQAGVEGAFGEGLAGAQEESAAGEQSAIRSIQAGTGLGVEALDPYAQAGGSAQQQAAALSGALGPEAEAAARQAQTESPYQQYLRDEAEKTIRRNASATGGLGGGNVQKALQDRSMALSGQFEQQRMENLMGLGGQGLTASGQQAGLYGQAGEAGADVRMQGSQQRAQNEMATSAFIGQSRSEQQAQLSSIAKERGMSEQELAKDMTQNLVKTVSETYGAQAQALLNEVLSEFDYANMGVNMVPNLIAALNAASPGSDTGAALAGAAGSVIGGYCAGRSDNGT